MANSNKQLSKNTVVVILAAGKGTRMGNPDMAKVCFEIDSVPAINRTISTFRKLGFGKFMLVVGANAEDVISTVDPGGASVSYVYQYPQQGTGHAAMCAANSLESLGFDGKILLTMGDKFIEPMTIDALVDGFVRDKANMAMLSIPKTPVTEMSGGRIFIDEASGALEIIEKTDIARQGVADELKILLKKSKSIKSSTVQDVINKHLPQKRKQGSAVGDLLALAETADKVDLKKLQKILSSPQYNINIVGKNYTAHEIESRCKDVNPSLYLFDAEMFYHGVKLIDNDNAQQEYYLTDIVSGLNGLLGPAGEKKCRISTVRINQPQWIQGFNSPDELLIIQDYLRKRDKKASAAVKSLRPKLKKTQFKTVERWIEQISSQKTSKRSWLKKIYGNNESMHESKCRDLLKVLKCFGKKFGFGEMVCIVRAPGRINLMGRHVDHRGGCNNFLAIDRETIAVASLRDDNNVVAINTQPQKFRTVKFNISELIGEFAWSEWIDFVNSDRVSQMLRSSAGQWGNYIRAALLRLQHEYQDIQLRGLNMAFTGDIPIAAGLSSSSSIVVAAGQAAIALNNLSLTSQQFIDLCGQGEWFVGSRGGAGDHAAIYLGQRGKITQVSYLPFEIRQVVDSPDGYSVMIANSHIKAAKSGPARDMFNSRVACYNIGLEILKKKCPQIAAAIEHVRDIDPEKLSCNTSDIYKWLLKLPDSMTRCEIADTLGSEFADFLEVNFATHNELPSYNIRGVLLYGAAEIARSRICIDALECGDIDLFGRLMQISHNGDRVSFFNSASRQYERAADTCSDEYLTGLVADLASEDPQRVLNAQLYMQPGSYYCSTPQIDKMVDAVCRVDGVAGAQLAGAGMGGCIMILARTDSVKAARKALVDAYYKPEGLKPSVITCSAVEGAGLIEF